MTDDLKNPPFTYSVSGELSDLALTTDIQRYLESAVPQNTKRAYLADWASFKTWCASQGLSPLPALPETVTLYVSHLAQEKKVSTIRRHLVTIGLAHKLKNLDDPTKHPLVQKVMKGIRREKGVAPTQKKPLMVPLLKNALEELPSNTPAAKRDRALLLLGFASALRRSELVSLDVEDLEEAEEGFVLTLRKSKTDQEGFSRKIGITYGKNIVTCPVRAVKEWLELLSPTEGPLFRSLKKGGKVTSHRLSDDAVALIVKKLLSRISIDPTEFSGHSLRSGLVTEAARGGASERTIQNQSGHRDLMTLRRYIREGELFRDNAIRFTRL